MSVLCILYSLYLFCSLAVFSVYQTVSKMNVISWCIAKHSCICNNQWGIGRCGKESCSFWVMIHVRVQNAVWNCKSGNRRVRCEIKCTNIYTCTQITAANGQCVKCEWKCKTSKQLMPTLSTTKKLSHFISHFTCCQLHTFADLHFSHIPDIISDHLGCTGRGRLLHSPIQSRQFLVYQKMELTLSITTGWLAITL